MKKIKSKSVLPGYIGRFSLVHVVTYLVCGLIFMNLMNYQKEFLQNESFSHFRPLNSPVVQAAVLFQFIRGAMFALILYPFRRVIIESKLGWLIMFAVIWGLTCVGAVNATPGSIEGLIYTEVGLKEHLIGMPEVIAQAMAFSGLFWLWERRADKKLHITSGKSAEGKDTDSITL